MRMQRIVRLSVRSLTASLRETSAKWLLLPRRRPPLALLASGGLLIGATSTQWSWAQDAAAISGASAVVTGEAMVQWALSGKPSVLPPAKPTVVISWGGIGAGKSTAAPLLFEHLHSTQGDYVAAGVDDLIEFVPEYRAAVESGESARKEAAYMQYRNVAKALKVPVIARAVQQRHNLYFEYTFEGNLQEFAAASPTAELAYEAEGYDVVLLLVSCYDLEGIQANAAKRERTIPAANIEKFNRNRTKFFVEAVNEIKKRAHTNNFSSLWARFLKTLNHNNNNNSLRVVVVERADANAPGILTDVTSAVPFTEEPQQSGGGWTEESARAAISIAVKAAQAQAPV